MSRRRRIQNAEAQAQVERRRKTVAHRRLRDRAARRANAPVAPEQGQATQPAIAEERVPTSELRAPLWLEDQADAADQAETAEQADADDRGEADESASDDQPTAVMPPVGDTAVMPSVPERAGVFPAAATTTSPTPVTPPESTALPTNAEPEATDAPPAAPEPASATDAVFPTAYETQPPKARRSRAAMAIPVLLLVLIGGYLGAQALVAGSVPRNTETLGIGIGGMDRAQAVAALGARAGEVEDEPITITAADAEYGVSASGAGLRVDPGATVDQVTGFTLAPQRLWQHVTGGGEILPVIDVDDAGFAEAMDKAVESLDRDAQDATVAIEGTSANVVPGRAAIVVDRDATSDAVLEAWPAVREVEATALITPPAIDDDIADGFATQLKTQAFANAVELSSEHGDVTVAPETLAAYAEVTSNGSALSLMIDGEALAATLVAAEPDLEDEARDASYSFTSSQQLQVEPATAGREIDPEALAEVVTFAAMSDLREGEIPFITTEPEVPSDALGAEDAVEIVSSFDTPLTADAVRTQNLRVAAASIQGVVLMPGDSFDLTEVLSPIDAANGYQNAGVIVNGVLQQGMGGGLSQVATTVFNAAYFAGYELVEHRPHSVWFTRYPAGRESTLYTGSINVVFTNNTPHAAVLNSYVTGGSLHVDVWSTPYFDVETSASPRSNIREPGVKRISDSNCQAKSAGQPGFTITNTRDTYLDGELVDTDSFTWTYQPDDAIQCVSADQADN